MHANRRGFTLIEILIVVVILGILAALVVPQLASATSLAVKSALARQLQMIDDNIAAYRASNADRFPTQDPLNPMGVGGGNSGWGVLVSVNYMKEEPRNTFTNQSQLAQGDAASAAAAPSSTESGWYYAVSSTRLDVFAVGYDRESGTLSNESH